MKNIKIILILLALLITGTSCSSQNFDENYFSSTNSNTSSNMALHNPKNISSMFKKRIPDTSNRDDINSVSGSGTSYGLYGIDGKIETDHNFNANQSLEKFISITHKVDKAWSYKLLLFVDYKQISFEVDDRIVNDFTFKMDPNQTIEIPVKIAPLSKGFHDAFFVIAKYTQVKSMDEKFRGITASGNLLFIRFTVTAGDNNMPQYNLTKNYRKTERKADNLTGLFVSKGAETLTGLLTQITKPNDIIQYYLHIGGSRLKTEQSFALVTLLDWKQIEIQNNNSVIFFNVDKGKEVIIPAMVHAPKKDDVYDLCPILIYNPYQKVTIDNSFIETSFRVGMQVKK